jgi:hypothetical protein
MVLNAAFLRSPRLGHAFRIARRTFVSIGISVVLAPLANARGLPEATGLFLRRILPPSGGLGPVTQFLASTPDRQFSQEQLHMLHKQLRKIGTVIRDWNQGR